MKLVVKDPSEKRKRRQLFPTPTNNRLHVKGSAAVVLEAPRVISSCLVNLVVTGIMCFIVATNGEYMCK